VKPYAKALGTRLGIPTSFAICSVGPEG